MMTKIKRNHHNLLSNNNAKKTISSHGERFWIDEIEKTGKLFDEILKNTTGKNCPDKKNDPEKNGQEYKTEHRIQNIYNLILELQKKLKKTFLGVGISIPPEIELYIDSTDNIKVKGEHPQKRIIEQYFIDNPGTAHYFRQLNNALSARKSIDEHKEMVSLYETDPEKAVNRYKYLFNHRRFIPKKDVTITIS